jgi:hypothetical protein
MVLKPPGHRRRVKPASVQAKIHRSAQGDYRLNSTRALPAWPKERRLNTTAGNPARRLPSEHGQGISRFPVPKCFPLVRAGRSEDSHRDTRVKGTGPGTCPPARRTTLYQASRSSSFSSCQSRQSVAWAESSRPTSPPRLPVGLEDSTHPTDSHLLILEILLIFMGDYR